MSQLRLGLSIKLMSPFFFIMFPSIKIFRYPSLMFIYTFYLIYFIFSVYVGGGWRQFWGVSYLFTPHGFYWSNSGHRSWHQVPWPAQTSNGSTSKKYHGTESWASNSWTFGGHPWIRSIPATLTISALGGVLPVLGRSYSLTRKSLSCKSSDAS